MRTALAIAVAIAGVLLVVGAALAQPRATFNCSSYAGFAAEIARYREVGAPLGKVISFLRKNNTPGLVLTAMEREAKRVYAEGLEADQAAWNAYKRCQDQLGEIGREG